MAFLSGDQLLGYMLASKPFKFKGQLSSIIKEYAHSSIAEEKNYIYQLLFPSLAEQVGYEGINLHLISHFANDQLLRETLFQLGFGAVVAEQLRDLSLVQNENRIDIVQFHDPSLIMGLIHEHAKYYQHSPIFITKRFDQNSIPIDRNECNPSSNALLA